MICPMAAFLGGVVAQEVVKFTGKFTAIHQFLYFEPWWQMVKIEEHWKNDRFLSFSWVYLGLLLWVEDKQKVDNMF